MTLDIVGYLNAKIDGVYNNGNVISCPAKVSQDAGIRDASTASIQ